MISLGGSSTYLQNQVMSGYDSVAQGFSATATTASASSLQAALNSFSSFETNETAALASMGSQQQISGAAEFSSPAAYIQNSAPDDEILRAFRDPSLASGSDLSQISAILSKITSDAEQKGIIIVSGSPTQLAQQASTKLEQAGLITPPQVGDSTKLEQAGLMTPPQFGGTTKLEQVGLMTPPQFGGTTKLEQVGLMTPPQVGGFAALQQGVSSRLEQAGLMTPPQIGASEAFLMKPSSQLEQAGLMTPPQFGGTTKLEQVGLMTPPQIGGSAPLQIPSDPHAPAQFGAFDAITFSSEQTTTLGSMLKTVTEALSLFQNLNLSMLSRKIVG